MVGRQDRWSPLSQHEEIAALIPDSELVIVEDSGHMVTVEQPDEVSRALLRWLGFGGETKTVPRHAASRARTL
jgi:pimeloyl-ACP methyl ester carboxylesterase